VTAFAIALAFYPAFAVPTATWQPTRSKHADEPGLVAEVTKKKAVLLIPGLQLHLLRPEKCREPEQHDWQRARSNLVRELSPDFDVYALGYTQCQPLDAVSLSFGMRSTVAALKAAGYREIVLVGHSAGGIISRQFIERFPNSGVTKVIQVTAPNAGSDYATIGLGIPKTQLPFLRSLAPDFRLSATPSTLKLPSNVDFVCLVCQGGNRRSDTIVDFDSQWSADLQNQGVPAVLVASYHNEAVKAEAPVKAIGILAREKLVRWSPDETATAKRILFKESPNKARGLGFLRP
jgi:pimeloyl-ACP methyl ester carboxylesterase